MPWCHVTLRPNTLQLLFAPAVACCWLCLVFWWYPGWIVVYHSLRALRPAFFSEWSLLMLRHRGGWPTVKLSAIWFTTLLTCSFSISFLFQLSGRHIVGRLGMKCEVHTLDAGVFRPLAQEHMQHHFCCEVLWVSDIGLSFTLDWQL